jgi:hypothetical protein
VGQTMLAKGLVRAVLKGAMPAQRSSVQQIFGLRPEQDEAVKQRALYRQCNRSVLANEGRRMPRYKQSSVFQRRVAVKRWL